MTKVSINTDNLDRDLIPYLDKALDNLNKAFEIATQLVIPEDYAFINEIETMKHEIERLKNEKKRLESEVERGEKMLSNPGFVSKAPEKKIQEEKDKLENYKNMLVSVEENLSKLLK